MKPAPAPLPISNVTREQILAKPKQIEIVAIDTITGGVQLRAEFDNDTIARYAEIYKIDGGSSFPPIVLFRDGDQLFIADGHHRLGAAKLAELTEIAAIVKKGDVRAATEYALESNHDHGLPLTNADKRAMVKILLDDEEWAKWSDREISRRCRVSPTFVGELRAKTPKAAAITTRKDKHGKERKTKNQKPIATDDQIADSLVRARKEVQTTADHLLESSTVKAWKTPMKAKIGAALFLGRGEIERAALDDLVGGSLDVHPGQLSRSGLVEAGQSESGATTYTLSKKARKQIEADLTAANPDSSHITLGPDSITATKDTDAEKPITVAKQAPLKQRRIEWMREHIAAKLSIGKVGACSMTEAAALSLIVGVTREAETRWSTKLLDRVAGQFIEAVGLSVAEALTKYSDGRYPEALSRLPDLPDLCRIYKIDHDALVINAERTVTE